MAEYFSLNSSWERGDGQVGESTLPVAESDVRGYLRPATDELCSDGRGQLYQAIVESEHFAPTEKAAKGTTIPIQVLSDNTIRVEGKEILLEGHRLYVFNALTITRHPAMAEDLRSFGFDPQAGGSDFAHAMTSLQKALKRAVGFDLIGKLNRGRQSLFVMNPNAVISDKRPHRQIGNASVAKNRRALHLRTESTVSFDKETDHGEYTDFASNQERDDALLCILKIYGTDSRVLKKINECKVRDLPMGGASPEFSKLANQFALLSKAEAQTLFSFIETGLSTYQSLANIHYPSPKEEEALINLAVAHRVLHFSNLKLVFSHARRIPPNILPLEDLIQEGNIGLQTAVNRFNHTLGYGFSTYATWWIRQAITRAVADTGRLIRFPIDAHAEWVTIEHHATDAVKALGRKPTNVELAKLSGFPIEKIDLYRRTTLPLVSLDRRVSDNDDRTLGGLLPDKGISMDEVADHISDRREVAELFANSGLDDREKLVLALRFGASDYLPPYLYVEKKSKPRQQVNHQEFIGNIAISGGMSGEAVGQILGLTRERIRQIERDALQKSRPFMQSLRKGEL